MGLYYDGAYGNRVILDHGWVSGGGLGTTYNHLSSFSTHVGQRVRRGEIIELAARQGKGWVDYMYKNPVSGKIEPKTTYILRVGDVVLEAGIYKN